MYPFSEFDLPDDMKPSRPERSEPAVTGALAPQWLHGLVEKLVAEERRRSREEDKALEEPAVR